MVEEKVIWDIAKTFEEVLPSEQESKESVERIKQRLYDSGLIKPLTEISHKDTNS